MAVELKVPSAGESITEVVIASWLKKEGDTVKRDEAVVEIETDKATLEVPSPVAGVIRKITKTQGQSATIGEVIAHIEEGTPQAASQTPVPSTSASPTPSPLIGGTKTFAFSPIRGGAR